MTSSARYSKRILPSQKVTWDLPSQRISLDSQVSSQEVTISSNNHGSIVPVAPTNTDSDRRLLDFVEFLPPELSLRCIYAALPSDADYTSRLLDISSVSRKWQDFICSAPILWSEIHLKWSEHDLLAKMVLFIHLSGVTPLKIIIWDDLGDTWHKIRILLLPHSDRIHELVLNRPARREVGTSDAATIINTLGQLPNLRQLYLDEDTRYLQQLRIDHTPPQLRIMSELDVFDLHTVELQVEVFNALSAIKTILSLEEIQSGLHLVPSLSSLYIAPSPRGSTPQRIVAPIEGTGLLYNLRRMIHRQPYSNTLQNLLWSTTSQLVHLTVEILSTEASWLIQALNQLEVLRELSIFVTVSPQPSLSEPKFAIQPGMASRTLLSLHLVADLAEDADISASRVADLLEDADISTNRESLDALTSGLARLYRAVVSVSLEGPFSGSAWPFLEGLGAIDCLLLQDVQHNFPTDHRLDLPSLSVLKLDHPLALNYIDAPDMLHLEVPRIGGQIARIKFPNLRHLRVLGSHWARSVYTLDPSSYPELRHLFIGAGSRPNIWTPTSLPQLVSITLTRWRFFNPRGNQLCMWLIYYPEYCPALREIHFDDFVEWDILFLMLERRNLGHERVARIEHVTLPFIPHLFRGPLEDVLNGRCEGKPSEYLPLSLEETREILFESTVLGCIACLKNMRPGCGAEALQISGPKALALFPEYDDPPDTVPSRIKNWLVEHKTMQEKWAASMAAFQTTRHRVWTCDRYQVDRPDTSIA